MMKFFLNLLSDGFIPQSTEFQRFFIDFKELGPVSYSCSMNMQYWPHSEQNN